MSIEAQRYHGVKYNEPEEYKGEERAVFPCMC